METLLHFSMTTCQMCVGKAHCEECGDNLVELLARNPVIQAASVDMKKRILRVRSEVSDEVLEEILEDRGVFRC